MTRAPAILIVDSSPDDTALSEVVLRGTHADADIRHVSDAASLADALSGAPPDVVVMAPALSWTGGVQVRELLKRHWPAAGLVLFGADNDIVQHCMDAGVAADAVAPKTSAGFLALPDIVRDVLTRPRGAQAEADQRGLALDELPLAALMVGLDGRIVDANLLAAEFLGRERARLRAVPLANFVSDEAEASRWRKLLGQPSGMVERIELDGAHAHGVCVVRHLAERDAGGAFLMCLEPAAPARSGVVVPHPAGEVPANQELRDIALVFSHDLKEPVQQIERLAKRIEERRADGEKSPDTKSMHQVLDCAHRARSMLDSMLEYLMVSAHETSTTLVDLNECLEQALNNLRTVIDEAGAEITSDHLPQIAGDEYQILHLFQNLLSNAIKFRGRESPRIRISAEAEGGEWMLSFRDNGIGISEPFLSRVFEMGQRLHTHDEYPGTGLGLALCRRIVERHGGRIWAESNDGAGTTFRVRVPRTPTRVTRLA